MTKPEMTLADSYREILKEHDELSASLARVRGLLQRMSAIVDQTGTYVDWDEHALYDALVLELYGYNRAESADIGKLDTADESAITFSQGAPPMAGTPSISSAGSAETGGEKAAPPRLKDTVSDSCMDGEHEGCDWGGECDCGCHDEERATL